MRPRSSRLPVSALLAVAPPGALLAAALIVDFLAPNQYYRFVVPVLVAVPALAAATSGLRGTLAFTSLSLGLVFLTAYLDGLLYSATFYGGLTALAVILAVSLLPGYQRGHRERKLARVRSVAEAVQRAVLVPIPDRLDCLSTATAYVAADEEARIGGDFYEALHTPFGVRIIIGDVRGKGVSAVGAAANLLGAFRETAPNAADLPALMARLEDSVCRYNARAGLPAGDFVTAAVVSVPPEPVAHLVCCGHPGPLLLRGAGAVLDVQASRPSLPLGLADLDGGYRVDTFGFDVGDCLLLYTDGVTEARDPAGDFYPLRERLAAWGEDEPERIVKRLVRDLPTFARGRLNDDAAVLAVRRHPPVRDEPTDEPTSQRRDPLTRPEERA